MLLGSPNMAASGGEDRTREPGVIPPSSSTSSLPTSIHDLLWEEKPKSLRELISSYRLPLAVKLKSGTISKYIPDNAVDNVTNGTSPTPHSASSSSLSGASPVKFSIGRDLNSSTRGSSPENKDISSAKSEDTVLQIHETRRRKIILARKMTWEKRQNDYVVTGEQVEIPASFKGWLEVVPDDGRPVEYFDTISGITSVKPKRFLVRTSTVGYQLTTEENGNSCWMPSEIKPGEVLTTGIIYMDSKKNKNVAQKNIFKRLLKQNKAKKEQDLKYLQCFDIEGREIMIPLIMSGVFSPVGDSSMANYDAVYELQDLIMAFGLPVNAQLIHANNKENYQCPRGVLRLYGTREEELAIVSKVGVDGALNRDVPKCDKFEIPADKEMTFSRGVVKKRPAIKAKLVDVFNSHFDKDKVKPKDHDRDIKDRDYVRAKSMDEFKLKSSQDKRLSVQGTNKTKPLAANYSNNYGTSGSGSEYRETNRKISQPTGSTVDENQPISKIPGNKQSSTSTTAATYSDSSQQNLEHNPNTDVELPERVPKELKKSRSTGILDKLSVRKVKKERAKLKELKGDDVFSKRIARNDLSYQDFFNGLDDDEDESKGNNNGNSKQDDSGRGSSNGTYQSNSSTPSNTTYSTTTSTPTIPYKDPKNKSVNDKSKTADKSTLIQRRQSIQNRDLPPIPPDSPRHEPASPSHTVNISKESLYEHLPPAPKPPPSQRRASESVLQSNIHSRYDDADEDDDEDGYMVPVQVQESRYVKRSEVDLRNKAPLANDSLKGARSRKARSAIPHEFAQKLRHEEGCPLDIDDLFSFTYNSREFGENRPLGAMGSPAAISTSQLYGAAKVPAWRSDLPPGMASFDQRFMDNLDLETRGHNDGRRQKSRRSRNMNGNPNATIRSHNLRKMRPSAMEVFHFTDSFRDVHAEAAQDQAFQDFQNNYLQNTYDQQNLYPQNRRPPLLNSRSMDASMMIPQLYQQQQQNIYGPGYNMNYAESEPSFRPNQRSVIPPGVSENFFKQGDDSAISMCSRGDGGYPNESEYSYNEYVEKAEADEGWSPPDEIEAMSVQEVSKSLRYIGMKDRVVLRFSNEQIDGSMLCTLDKKLLKEGFPELNALEVKKIIDFVQGWRPKKR